MNSKKAEPKDKIRALTIGVDEGALRVMREVLPSVDFRNLPMDISKFLKTEGERDPDLIFCGRTHVDVDLVELAQGVRSFYADPPMYYVSSMNQGFDQQVFIRNGFADAFLLPMDRGALSSIVPDGANEFKDVPLIGLTQDTILEFDTFVFLPLNQKYVRFSAGGRKLEGHRAKRLIAHDVRNVYVSKNQLPAYHRFTAKQLKNIATEPEASTGDRRLKMHKAVRALLVSFFSDNAVMQDYAEIVKNYILESSPKTAPIFERMLEFTSGADEVYSHVSNVSSLAVLFALGLGIGKPEEIALAGLLHDVGLAAVPLEVQEKTSAKRSEREQRIYNEHPAHALTLIRKRQIELSTKVLKIIEQHHERWDATGYPFELRGNAIFPESQLLGIADEFEYLTQIKSGKSRLTAHDAIQSILCNPGFDPELLKRLAELLGTSVA